MPLKEYRKKEHERTSDDLLKSIQDLTRARINAYNADINNINTWMNSVSSSVDSCDVDIADISKISTRITELSKDLESHRHQLSNAVINDMYNRVEQLKSNLVNTIKEINTKCIIQKK